MELNLSHGEWRLMNTLWQRSPMTITEIVAALRFDTGWTKHTVITMLNRLEAKGAVRHEQGSRAKLFYAAVERQGVAAQETESFLDRVYGGSVGLMVNTLLRDHGLTQSELEELRAVLDAADGEKRR
jgi:BlaI family penicillinase repressor